MINIIWAIMAIIGIVYAMFNGTMSDVNEAILSSASEAVTLTIGLISVLVFWLGMMEIAKKAGILDILSNLFKPIAKRIFPEIP
ncbi:MAG TPA: spore maturation protein, partial [Bacillota bacterium]|nr:spore maturation protein [Bacillota bacterium]